MKYFMKKFVGIGLGAMLISCAALCGCGETPAPSPTEKKPQYAVPAEIPSVAANDESFSVKNIAKREDSPLAGKTFYWLGSSVTYGSASQGESMADYLAAYTGCTSVKEAVSGTTIYDDGGNGDSGAKSYTRRMVKGTAFDKTAQIDALICQISTNDARNDRLTKWGKMRDDEGVYKDYFDKSTTLGGVEYIIAYAIETWQCPVYFYSGAYFGDSGTRASTNPTGTNYGKLVDEVKKIATKWQNMGYEVGVIDLFNDEAFNATASDEYYKWATSDAIHPKRAGYAQWWTPYFEAYLLNVFD